MYVVIYIEEIFFVNNNLNYKRNILKLVSRNYFKIYFKENSLRKVFVVFGGKVLECVYDVYRNMIYFYLYVIFKVILFFIIRKY